MRSAIALLTVFLLCYSANAIDDDCKDYLMDLKRAMRKMIDEDTVPQCAKDLEMIQFKCTVGKDPEYDRQIKEKLKEWLANLDDDKKKAVTECAVGFEKAAQETMGDQLSEECKNKMKEFEGKMMLQ